MAEAMNTELLALRDAGCRCIQIEEPTFHFMANTFGKDHHGVKFMIDAFDREVQGWTTSNCVHTCWGNPHMQRVIEDTAAPRRSRSTSNAAGRRLDARDEGSRPEGRRAVRAVQARPEEEGRHGHRDRGTLQADRPEDVASEIRRALKYIPAERLIVSSDCGFGRQGCNREIAFYKASAIAQGCNIVRAELGLATSYVPAADPMLQLDVVPGRPEAGR